MARPQLNFTTDLDRVVALNSQVGLLSQKLTAIERTSSAIFRNDPFANMAVTAGRASGVTASLLKNLHGIQEKLLAINNLNGVAGFASRPAVPTMTGAAGANFRGGSVTFQGPAAFMPPTPFKPETGMLLQPDKFIDPHYGFADLPKRDRTEARETARQLLLVGKRLSTYRIGGMGATSKRLSLAELERGEGLVNQYYPEGTIRDIGLADLELKKKQVLRAYAASQASAETAAQRQAREAWNQRNVLIRGYVGGMKGGTLSDSDDATLQNLMNLQRDALMNNSMGFSKWRMKAASNTYQGFRGTIGTSPDALLDRVMNASRGFESQLDSGIQRGLRGNTVTGINDLRSRVDDFMLGRMGQKNLDPQDQRAAEQLRTELQQRRADLAQRRTAGNLTGTGFDSNSIRGVIKGLDSEIGKLDRVLRQSNKSVDALHGGFMRLAGAVVGIQSLRDLFMNATQQAVQFDRTLAQIQARSQRLSDPSQRKGFTNSIIKSSLEDAMRTGMSIQQVAQVQETVHLAASGTLQQKAALGSTINNLAFTTDTPTSEYLGVIAPMNKMGFDADAVRSFLERSAMFQSRYGVDKSRMNAFFTSFTSGINAMGPLADMDTIEAAARQEAAGARDMVLGSKLNRMQTGFMSAKTRTRLQDILGRNGEREVIGDFTVDQILNSGNAVLSMDMITKAHKQGAISQKELLGIAQTMDQWSGNQTYAMLSKGLDSYRAEVSADRAVVAAGGGNSTTAANTAGASIGATFDRMSNAMAALTAQGITPLGGALKLLMNIVSSVTGGMSKIPYVTETVVTALGALATAMLARKGIDWMGDALANAAKAGGGGMKGFFSNAIGTGGLIGAAVGAAVGIGGAAYNHYEQKALAADVRSNDMLRNSMPDLQRRMDGSANITALLSDIEASAGRGEDVTKKREELVALVRAQNVSEEAVLTLQKAQTAELREQQAIKTAMTNSNTAREDVSAVRDLALFAQEAQIIGRFAGGSQTKWASAEEGASLEAVLKKFAPTAQRESYEKSLATNLAMYQNDYGMDAATATTRARSRALSEWADTHKYELEWMGAYGSKVSAVGAFGQNLEVGRQQMTTIWQQKNSEKYAASAALMSEASANKRKMTHQEVADFTWNATQSNLYGNTKDNDIVAALTKLPREFATELAIVLQQQYDAADASIRGGSTSDNGGWGNLRKEFFARNPTKQAEHTTSREFADWLYERSNTELLGMRNLAPAQIDEILAQKERAVMLPALKDSGKAPKPERGRAGGGGGSINYLSIMEKYFSGIERAFGQGDFEGVASISNDFAAMSARLTGQDYKDPIDTIKKLEQMSLASAEKNFKNQKKELDLSKSGRPADQLKVERDLLEARYMQEREIIKGMATMSVQKASPEGRRKGARKLIDEAFKQDLDERQIASWQSTYGQLDLSSASDEELAVAQLLMSGRTAVANRGRLNELRSTDLNTLKKSFGVDFADKDAAMQHIDQLDKQQILDQVNIRKNLARMTLSFDAKAGEAELGAIRAWGSTAEMFGSDESRRRVQVQSITGEMEILMRRQEKMAELGNASASERLEVETKIKALDVERLKLTEEMVQATKLKQVGDDMTRQTVATLFTGDPTTRNKSLADMWTKLPMQGISDSITKTLIGMDGSNPVGAIARFMFDPGGEMTYKENITKLNDSIRDLIASNEALASAYSGSARGAEAAAQQQASIQSAGGLDLSMDFSKLKFGDSGLAFGSDSYLSDYTFAGAALSGTSAPEGVSSPSDPAIERTQLAIAQRAGNGQVATRSGMTNLVDTGVNAFSGANFWKPATAYTTAGKPVGGTRGVEYNSKGNLKMTGAGWGVAGAQVAMGAYSGYMAGKSTGSQAAANWGAAGGALGAGASAAFVAFGVSNPVGWVMLAAAAIAQIMSATNAAAKAAEDKTKAYKKQEADFMRQVAINEEQRKQLGLAADRVLSERADVGNAFTGVAASAFLSGRFASNAMQVNVQNLTVQANNPQELSAALAGTFTQQVGRGLN